MTTQPQIPLWISLPLSLIMIAFSTLTYLGDLRPPAASPPVFTTIRDPKNSLPMLTQRLHEVQPAFIYTHLKGSASIVWSVLIPLQHSASVRRSWSLAHRVSGYVCVVLSSVLGAAGYYLVVRGWITTHPDLFHLHRLPLRVPGGGSTAMAIYWPSFALGIWALAPPYFLSLVMLVRKARQGDYEAHRRWAVGFSIVGYAIAVERVWVLGLMGVAEVGHAVMEARFKNEFLGLPVEMDEVVRAEVAAFAATLVLALVVVGCWAWWEFRGKERRLAARMKQS